MSVTAPEVPAVPEAQASTPTEPAAPPVAVPEAPVVPTGPWSNDLASTFEDPALRGQVDDFLRGKVQPYVTTLETKAKDLEAAGALISDLQQNPDETYIAIAQSIWGDEAAARLRTALADPSYGAAPVAPAVEAQPPEGPAPLDPRVQAIIDEREEADRLNAYNAEVDALIAKDPRIDRELLHPFVVTAEGDMNAAHAAYIQWLDKAQAASGETRPTDPPPAVLGSDTPGATAPPVATKSLSMDQAMDEFFAENRTAPPVMGAV